MIPPPPLSAQAPPSPARIGPRRAASPTPPAQLTEASTPIDVGTKSIISIVGDATGLHVYRSSTPAAPASSGSTAGQMPTGGQLDAMEFVVDVSPGSLEELVRNVDGAFFRNRRLYDARGNAVSSMDRYQIGSRLIVFFAVDGAMQVVLPTTVVDAVLRQVAAKSPAHTPRRVTAHFDASGMLRNVDIEA